MPDLSLDYCHEYWANHSDPLVYKALCFMESIEDWVIDDIEGVEEAIGVLGNVLENIDNIDLKHSDDFISVIANVRATRNLMMLQVLNEAYPGSVAKLVKHAEALSSNNEVCKLFIKRHVLFERLRLMGKIFSEEATKGIMEILESKK